MPPAPSRPSSRYGPTDAGSPGLRSLITAGRAARAPTKQHYPTPPTSQQTRFMPISVGGRVISRQRREARDPELHGLCRLYPALGSWGYQVKHEPVRNILFAVFYWFIM